MQMARGLEDSMRMRNECWIILDGVAMADVEVKVDNKQRSSGKKERAPNRLKRGVYTARQSWHTAHTIGVLYAQ